MAGIITIPAISIEYGLIFLKEDAISYYPFKIAMYLGC